MRIVVYPHLLDIGGSQINAIELAAAVRDRGHDVFVFAARSGPLAGLVERLRLPLVLAPEHKIRPSPIIAQALRDLCRRERIDVVHGYEWPPAIEGFFGPLLRDRVSVGCTVMSMSVAPFIPRSTPLIVGTEQIAAAARKAGAFSVGVIEPPVDTHSNHPGIDASGFRQSYGLGHRPVVVLVSRLAMALKLEGIERAIAAAELLAATTPIQLVIVGDGPARGQLEEAAAAVNTRTGERTVVLTGELEDPRPAYAASDIVLGMGGSALRAMAFAKPLVVLGERGFAELLTPESSALFLWQGFYGLGDGNLDARRLAAIMAPLLSDGALRARLGAYARDFVESRFSLEASAARQEEFYGQWLREQPSHARVMKEAAGTALQLFAHKAARRLRRLRGTEESEDFNAVAQIARVAATAPRSA